MTLRDENSSPHIGWALLSVSFLIFAIAAYFRSLSFGVLSFFLLWWSFVFNSQVYRGLWRGGVFLLFFLPPPVSLTTMVMSRLQETTVSLASRVLDVAEYPHVVLGSVIELTNSTQLLVSEACSGIRSLFAILALSAFYSLWNRLSISRAFLLMVASFLWTLWANTFRIVVIVYSTRFEMLNLTKEPLHTLLGFLTFTLILFLVRSTLQWCEIKRAIRGDYSFEENSDHRDDPSSPRFRQGWNILLAGTYRPLPGLPVIAILSIALAGLQLVRGVSRSKTSIEVEQRAGASGITSKLNQLSVTSLPKMLAKYHQQSFRRVDREMDSFLGSHSLEWTYQKVRPVQLSVDFPFRGYHELSYCYGSQGWKVKDYQAIKLPNGMEATRFLLENPKGLHGMVIFANFSASGQTISKPPSMLRELAEDRMRDLYVYQIQAFTSDTKPISDVEEVSDLFAAAVDRFLRGDAK